LYFKFGACPADIRLIVAVSGRKTLSPLPYDSTFRAKKKANPKTSLPFRRKLFGSVNADLFLVFSDSFKSDDSVDKSVQSIVASDSDIVTGMDFSSSLSYENISRKNFLTVGTFCSETFSVAVTSVLRASHSFVVRK
jgi:hypothetical protein